MTNEYQLADKLKKQFRGRGSEVFGMRATTTSELMRRAEMGRDPRINCAEQAFRENYRRRNTPQTPQPVSRKSAASTDVRHTASGTAQTPRRAETHRSEVLYEDRDEAWERMRQAAQAEAAARAERQKQAEAAPVEKQLQKKYIPPMLLAFLIVGTILFLSFVFSITEVYKASRQLEQMENQLSQLEETAQDMELQLEEKNDIREIEAIATGRLGMVKEDSLQRRFVSLSDGERIELAETEEEPAAGGVMLSSVFSALGRFFERFR